MDIQLDIVALIPARSGSKGVKNKNILALDGHPLIGYAAIAARQSELINEVYVTTDSEEYRCVSKKYGALAPFLRPTEISGDLRTDKEFFFHFIEWCREVRGKIPDMIVHLRPTTPLRNFHKIDRAIQKLIDNSEASALRSCQETELTPYKMFFENDGYMNPFMIDPAYVESYNQPRQIFPKTYLPNGYVDIIRPKVLLDTNLLHGKKILLYLTPATSDIDDINDYEFAKQALNYEEYLTLKVSLAEQLL